MKILIINCVSDRCEVGLYTKLLASGVHVDFILDPRDTSKEMLRALGARVDALEMRSRMHLSSYFSLKKTLMENNYDVVFAPTSRGITLAIQAARQLKAKLVTYRGTLGNLSRWSLASRFAHLHPRIDAIVCNSQGVKNYLLSLGLKSELLPVIYKGHDPSWYDTIAPADLQTEFSIPKESLVVSCIANIRPLKGIAVLLESAARVKSSLPLHYLLVGSLQDKKLPALAAHLGIEDRVHFTGFRDDALSLLKSSDITVMPSVRREGVPRAIAESMGLGIPSIVSDIGGLPELVSDGKTGLVVPASDSEALARALEMLAQSEMMRNDFGVAARRRLREHFSLELYAESMLQLFRSLHASTSEALEGTARRE